VIELELPPVVAAFGRRLHEAGVPVTAERSARFAEALTLVNPIARTRLYWTARAVLVSDPAQVKAFDAVFFSVFGSRVPDAEVPEDARSVPAPPDDRPATARRNAAEGSSAPGGAASSPPSGDGPGQDVAVPMAASDEERLRGKRFDALEPGELAQLYRLMARLQIATPLRRTRRAVRDRRGQHVDLRRTLRTSLRTGGDPIRLAHRRRRIVRRRLVLLCDISGSMEPYARAYLQFLTCAAGSGPNAEAFVFATRLTRVTRALASRSARSSARRPPRRTGRAARASAMRCARSTTATDAAGWPAAR
jgi:uncharacterized protein with von Willebrand factor type A (vWA) domain